MEQSTIHIKAPHTVHIAAKVRAAQKRISMNQYVIDLIRKDMGEKGIKEEVLEIGIEAARKATPAQKKIIKKAEKVFEDLKPISYKPTNNWGA